MDDKGYQAGDALPDEACGNYQQQPTNDQIFKQETTEKAESGFEPGLCFLCWLLFVVSNFSNLHQARLDEIQTS
jgi:hypothetical protein